MGLPWHHYYFSEGRVCVEASEEEDGFSEIRYYGIQPLPGAVIFKGRAITLNYEGKLIPFSHMEIFPFGFINDWRNEGEEHRYAMALFPRGVVFLFPEENREREIILSIPVASFVDKLKHTDEFGRTHEVRSVKEGLGFKEEIDGLFFRIHDRLTVERKRSSQVLREVNVLQLPDLTMEADVYGVCVANQPLTYRKVNGNHLLRVNSKEKTAFAFIFTNDEGELKRETNSFRKDADKYFETQYRRYQSIAVRLPEIKIKGSLGIGHYHHIPEFFKKQPLYIESCKVEDTGAFKANNFYYWVWSWDMSCPCFGLLEAGDYEGVKKAILFLDNVYLDGVGIGSAYTGDFKHYHTSSICGAHNLNYIALVYRYYIYTLDEETVRKVYPNLRKLFLEIYSRADETGLFLGRGSGTDNPEEFGRTAFAYVALDSGWWYEACRCLGRLSLLLGDEEIREKTKEIAGKIRDNFMRIFYNPEMGFLYEGVHPLSQPLELAGEKNDTPLVSNLGLFHGYYGEELVDEKRMEELADFAEEAFLREDGIHYKPVWEKRGYYGWTRIGENWFPFHDMYLCRLLRKTGRGKALEKILNLYEINFALYKAVFEGKSFKKPIATPGVWQSFSAGSWYSTLVQSIVGIEIDEGGISYIPADISLGMDLSGVKFRDSVWNIEVRGSGRWAEGITVDGRLLPGTLKVPREMLVDGAHTLNIERKDIVSHPVLLEAVNAYVKRIRIAEDSLSFKVEGRGSIPVKFYSPWIPAVEVDGKPVQLFWHSVGAGYSGMGRITVQLKEGEAIITIGKKGCSGTGGKI